VTPLQLARALGGIASGGALKRPHVVFPDELPPDMASAIAASYPGSGDRVIPITTRELGDHHRRHGATTAPGRLTPARVHLEGIDFAGKTGTAQLVNHSIGGQPPVDRKRARQRLVRRHGAAPQSRYRRCCAGEHGGWGADSRRSPRRAGHQRIRDQAAHGARAI
jgi:penicillin-binding protein 2